MREVGRQGQVRGWGGDGSGCGCYCTPALLCLTRKAALTIHPPHFPHSPAPPLPHIPPSPPTPPGRPAPDAPSPHRALVPIGPRGGRRRLRADLLHHRGSRVRPPLLALPAGRLLHQAQARATAPHDPLRRLPGESAGMDGMLGMMSACPASLVLCTGSRQLCPTVCRQPQPQYPLRTSPPSPTPCPPPPPPPPNPPPP